jgi:hypothetical protein
MIPAVLSVDAINKMSPAQKTVTEMTATRKPKRFGVTLAYVRWFDSAIYKGEPCAAEELTGFMENESSGILVRETRNEVALALDRCLETKNLRLILCIPRANIRAIRKICV